MYMKNLQADLLWGPVPLDHRHVGCIGFLRVKACGGALKETKNELHEN